MTSRSHHCPTSAAAPGHPCRVVVAGAFVNTPAVDHPERVALARVEGVAAITRPGRRSRWREAQPELSPSGSGWPRK